MKIELAAFVLSANLSIEISGELYDETNTHINVKIRDDKHRSAEEFIEGGHFRRGIYGRSNGTIEKLPTVVEALKDLIDKISGKEILFGDRKVRVPQLVLSKFISNYR